MSSNRLRLPRALVRLHLDCGIVGNDAFTFAAWIAAHTKRVRIGTGIVQMAARTPVATAMAAATIDHLRRSFHTRARSIRPAGCGGLVWATLGTPLARTRDYVEIIRRVLRREDALSTSRRVLPASLLRSRLSRTGQTSEIDDPPAPIRYAIFIAAEGPKRDADGGHRRWMAPALLLALAPRDLRRPIVGAKPGFEITALVNFTITDDMAAGLLPVKQMLGFYIGGMGAKGQNYHTKLMQRMGFEEEALRVQELFFEGRREEAILAVQTIRR